MTAIDLITHPLAQRLTWTLAHFLWQGALIAIVLALVVELFRIRSAHARYACSLAALVLMVMIVPLTWLALGDVGWTSGPTAMMDSKAVTDSVGPEVQPTRPAPAAALSTHFMAWLVTLQPTLFLFWLSGFLLLNARILLGWLATQGLLRSREPLSVDLAARFARLGSRFQLPISEVVFASRKVTEAIAVGFLKPVVLLPAAWIAEMPPHLLEAIVAHELAHLRRCDLWVNLLQRLAEAVLFYHPALWWLSARLRRERELCCDELAVAATGQRLEYAEALELTARLAAVEGRPALAAGFFGESKMNLLHRVRCVLGSSAERPGIPGNERASLWPASLLLGGLSLALVAAIYGASTSSVNAQEEKKAPAKEGERREGEVRREGDRPREGAAEVRRDGDRPRPDGAPRDGERRPDARRPDAPRPDAPRPDANRGGDRPRPDAPRPDAPRDGEARRPVPGGEQGEMMAIIRQLRAEVAELRAEVARLRGDGGGIRGISGDVRRPAEGERREGGDRPRPAVERPREGADRPAAERPREGGDRPAADRPREGGDRPAPDRPRPEGERREGGDRPKAEGERK